MKKYWTWILGVFSVLLGMFFLERHRRKEAESQIEGAEFKAQDQVLKYQQDQNKTKIDSDKQQLEQLRKDHDKSTQEAQKDLTPEQVEEYWKRRNNSN